MDKDDQETGGARMAELGPAAYGKLQATENRLQDIAAELCAMRRSVLTGADEAAFLKVEGAILDAVGASTKARRPEVLAVSFYR